MLGNEDELVEKIASEEEDEETAVPIYKIGAYPSDPTLELLNTRWQRGEITVQKFQRGWVWKPPQASKLVDSFLLGLPVPEIFVYRDPISEKHIVIDGQQRLRTIVGFFEGILPDGTDFYLRNVSVQWEGKHYNDLSEAEQRRFRNTTLRVVVIEQSDPKDNSSMYAIFERLNTGGTALTPQEVRNCVYYGPFNDLIIELNRNEQWRQIFGSNDPDKRMRDIEIIIRFLSLYEKSENYYKPMKKFLSDYMKDQRWDKNREPYQSTFVETVNRICKTLGPKPFNITRGINVAICDSVMVAFARSSNTPSDITKRFQALRANLSYVDAITQHTTDADKVKNRIKLAEEILFR
ncbi:MAG: DUF262 domain-containing protein [Chloroflexota bacterium]